jgi:hypothetical protein
LAKEAQILLQALVGVEAGLPCLALEVEVEDLPYLALGVVEDRWKMAKEVVVAGQNLMEVEVLVEHLMEEVVEGRCCDSVVEEEAYMTRLESSVVRQAGDLRLYLVEPVVQHLSMEVQAVLRSFDLL